MLVTIMLCTNDPDNGNDLERLAAVHVWAKGEPIALELSCVRTEPRCRVQTARLGTRMLRIGHKRFPINAEKEWFGNWCWNAVWVTPAVAARIVNHLKAMGKFECEGGLTEMFDKWERGEAFTADDFTVDAKSPSNDAGEPESKRMSLLTQGERQ